VTKQCAENVAVQILIVDDSPVYRQLLTSHPQDRGVPFKITNTGSENQDASATHGLSEAGLEPEKQKETHHPGHEQNGFSLIELMVVVAIILIIAAIAIPNLLRARIAANEASAVGSLRTINIAMIAYNLTYPTVGFAGSLSVLGSTPCNPNAATPCLLDGVLAGGTKSGYKVRSHQRRGAPN
jgi:prepilin-type N-terminal cleavage/methylation domain-containing protein